MASPPPAEVPKRPTLAGFRTLTACSMVVGRFVESRREAHHARHHTSILPTSVQAATASSRPAG